MTRRMRSAYGRVARMRSCALRILLAATISMAFVIFCVILKLASLTRISFTPGMSFRRLRATGYGLQSEKALCAHSVRPVACRLSPVASSIRSCRCELFADLLERRLVLGREHGIGEHCVDGLLVVRLCERLQSALERADLLQI